ncbi:MAG: thioredoxin domain-containing protein [Deltaproteobacteria bacterium]|nr:thioredoxin domain-containing protein [Deltaproteobacteria bacterium]
MANKLADQASAYLRQHADQPVDWYPWGPEALEKARAEDKPIFLSIGYSTCHWCHVMARESFADNEVADKLRADYVAVKVDREERPDLDQLYMLACQFFTGGGGWPLSIFMTPDGVPFFAGTYFPKRGGRYLNVPGFVEILDYLAGRWRNERESLLKNGREVVRLLRSMAEVKPLDRPLSVDLLGAAAEQLAENFDAENGGFGEAPKFPSPHQLLFLLRWHQRSDSRIALEMVEKTLAAITAGGIFDHLGGGFHRYAVDKQWRIPHFEKMLYDQAMLILALSEAAVLGDPSRYREPVAAVISWLTREMRCTDDLFAAAQDADSEGVEGAYYVWTRAQIEEVLGERAGLFCRHYGVEEDGNFPEIKGANVLRRVTEAGDAELEAELADCRQKLFVARSRRPAPFIDTKVLAAWNGLLIAALARAGAVFEEAEWQRLAAAAARKLELLLGREHDRLWRCRTAADEPGIPAFLDDYAFFIWGLLELAASDTEKPLFLEKARRLTETVNRLFWDEKGERFYFSGSDAESLVARNLELHDGALPASNSAMILNLLGLYRLTGEKRYFEQAEKVLGRGAGLAGQTPLLYLHYLSALDEYLRIVASG